MCDHCGCRDLLPIGELMDEHDRLRELSAHVRSHLAAGEDAAARTHLTELLVVLGPHVGKEEGYLFPQLRRSAELTDHVGVLEGEHAALYDDVDDLDDAAGEEWRAGVLRVLDALAEHMFKEDFGLFPAALATLDGADWDAMAGWGSAGQPAGSSSSVGQSSGGSPASAASRSTVSSTTSSGGGAPLGEASSGRTSAGSRSEPVASRAQAAKPSASASTSTGSEASGSSK
ncbi:hemerythrin domain-containing protein [Blastococcus sp. CCUG 61487]|uniref:hemerythrin domain-containing protein n=1 Tax=Blastococcus sp. CCUG 61487 TaxID=1840703 RepID=UPI0010C09585|nr:hemerythrin domain-containing protein [Blastococcus sp. CCUG 61487]TKJ19836.1 hypothetical protein A6V29_09695 [Blastococcus sp. CCUG 61487]